MIRKRDGREVQWNVDGSVCRTSAAFLAGIYIDSISYPVTYPRLRHLEVMADSERKSGKQY